MFTAEVRRADRVPGSDARQLLSHEDSDAEGESSPEAARAGLDRRRWVHYAGLLMGGAAVIAAASHAVPSIAGTSLRSGGERGTSELYSAPALLQAPALPTWQPPPTLPPMPVVPLAPLRMEMPTTPPMPVWTPPPAPEPMALPYWVPPTLPPLATPPPLPAMQVPVPLEWSPPDAIIGSQAVKPTQEDADEAEKEVVPEKPTTTKPEPKGPRRGSFMVIGDWGWSEKMHGNVPNTTCQKTIADRMLEKFKALGDVRFIINVGDSFYPEGLKGKDDPQWDTKWRNIYAPELRSVPWYSVYGNHDYHHDPCACAEDPNECAQVNYNVYDTSRFYMPGFNYFVEHHDLGVEVIGLDMNRFMEGWNGTAPLDDLHFNDCQWTQCPEECYGNTDARALQGFDLFRERREKSKAKHMIIFSHYPTDYFQAMPSFLANLSDSSKTPLTYFGGHRHSTDNHSTWQIYPNINWLVGGGGGWSCDSQEQGFVVGEIQHNFKIKTYAELVDPAICCGEWR